MLEQAKIWHGGGHVNIFEPSAIGFQQHRISEGKANRVYAKLSPASERKTEWSCWPIQCAMMILQSPANAYCKAAFSFLRGEASRLSNWGIACMSEMKKCAYQKEGIRNNVNVVGLLLVVISLDQMLGAEIKQAYTSLKMEAEWKAWEAELYCKSYVSLYKRTTTFSLAFLLWFMQEKSGIK